MAQARRNHYGAAPSPEMGVIGWTIAAAIALLLLPLLPFALLVRVLMRWAGGDSSDRSRYRSGI